MYYNTTNESAEQLKTFKGKATKQENEILQLFKRDSFLSPSDVQKEFQNYPLTSVRRAITNLTIAGLLEKTADKRPGIYGRNECVWKYKC
jgi:Fe2+ or Zn2+ uptake regulation protein